MKKIKIKPKENMTIIIILVVIHFQLHIIYLNGHNTNIVALSSPTLHFSGISEDTDKKKEI